MERDSSPRPRSEAESDLETGQDDESRGETDDGRVDGMDVEAYRTRIGVDPAAVEGPDLETLERLQRAHVTAVPFENLAIVGDPYGDREGPGVPLSVPDFYEKIVERGRGGYCFELNGLFHWLLAELGYDVDRVAACVTSDGRVRVPANHHANVVELDRRYVVDVGTSAPMLRRPLPLDGTPRSDAAGIEWRIVESDRPDATYRTEFRRPGEDAWAIRSVFDDIPRDLSYFAATNDYLQAAPESPFTDEPTVVIATESGHLTLSRDTLTETSGADERESSVSGEDWHATLERAFDLSFERG